jgi:hypothetical protein
VILTDVEDTSVLPVCPIVASKLKAPGGEVCESLIMGLGRSGDSALPKRVTEPKKLNGMASARMRPEVQITSDPITTKQEVDLNIERGILGLVQESRHEFSVTSNSTPISLIYRTFDE